MGMTHRCAEYINSVLGDANLWNDLGFSLCAILFIYYIVTTLDEWMKSKMGVSADWYITIEYWRSSSIGIFINYQASKLQYNY